MYLRKVRNMVIGQEEKKRLCCNRETLALMEAVLDGGAAEDKRLVLEILGSLGHLADRDKRAEVAERMEDRIIRELEAALGTGANLLPTLRCIKTVFMATQRRLGEAVDLVERYLSGLPEYESGGEIVDRVYKDPALHHEALCSGEALAFLASLALCRGMQSRFRTREFFGMLNRRMEINGYWVFILITLLVDRETLDYVDACKLKREAKRDTDVVGWKSMGYVCHGLVVACKMERDDHKEEEAEEVAEDPQRNIVLPWNVTRRERLMGTMINVRKEERKASKFSYELYDIIDNLAERKDEPFSLAVLSQIVGSSMEAQRYVKERGLLKSIMEETMRTGSSKQIKHICFINECVGSREENRRAAIDTGFFGEVVRQIEKKIDESMYDIFLLSGLSTVKLMSRSTAIVKGDLSNYPIIEVIERILEELPAAGLQDPEEADMGTRILKESLSALSNILLANTRWKSIFINRSILSRLKQHLQNQEIEATIFLLLKNLVCEDDVKTKDTLISELGVAFFKRSMGDRSPESRIEYYGIVRNIICNNKNMLGLVEKKEPQTGHTDTERDILSIIPWYVKEFEAEALRFVRLQSAGPGGGEADQHASAVLLQLVYILVNVASLGAFSRLITRPSTLKLVLKVFQEGDKDLREGCVWYVINTTWTRDEEVTGEMLRLGFKDVLSVESDDPRFLERVQCARRHLEWG